MWPGFDSGPFEFAVGSHLSLGSPVFHPAQKPKSNLTRIENLHENRLGLMWPPP